MGEMILCPHCAEYDIPDHSAITESERQDYEQQIKDGQAREKELEEKLNDWQETHTNIMNENCAGDERHCTCVPSLRKQIKELEDDIALEVKTFIKQEQQIKELKGYAAHHVRCKKLHQYLIKPKCTCGLDELLNKH